MFDWELAVNGEEPFRIAPYNVGDCMKKIAVITILLCLILPTILFAKEFMVFNYQDSSCGAWVNSLDNHIVREHYNSWFRGFVSGYNFGSPDKLIESNKMPNKETLFLFIDKFCRENPLKQFTSAAFDLVKDLQEQETPKKTPQKKKGQQ